MQDGMFRQTAFLFPGFQAANVGTPEPGQERFNSTLPLGRPKVALRVPSSLGSNGPLHGA